MKIRILILVTVIGFGAIAFGWVYESRLRSQVETAELIIPDNIDYFLTNLKYRSMTVDGELDYEFESPRLEHHPRTDVSYIESPSIQIYRDADHWQVDSGRGEIIHPENLLWLRDQVVMRRLGDDPLALYTDSIRFEPDRDRLASDSGILLQTRQARIEAEGIVFDLEEKVYKLTKARAIYYDDQS